MRQIQVSLDSYILPAPHFSHRAPLNYSLWLSPHTCPSDDHCFFFHSESFNNVAKQIEIGYRNDMPETLFGRFLVLVDYLVHKQTLLELQNA